MLSAVAEETRRLITLGCLSITLWGAADLRFPVDNLRATAEPGGTMNGSLEVRQFLSRQDEGLGRTSSGVPSPRDGETVEFSREQLHRARLAVARGSENAQDCKMLLDMLGLLPDEDEEPPGAR